MQRCGDKGTEIQSILFQYAVAILDHFNLFLKEYKIEIIDSKKRDFNLPADATVHETVIGNISNLKKISEYAKELDYLITCTKVYFY